MVNKMKTIAATAALATAMTLGAQAASATTVTFSSFDSTETIQLNPVVTISDAVENEFLVTLTLASTEVGDLVAVYFDLDPAPSNIELATLTASSVDPALTATQVANGDFKYQFLNSINAGTDTFCESNILAGNFGDDSISLPTFEGSICYRNNGSNQPDVASPVSFKIVDTQGVLSLKDFASLGIRYKSSNNGSTTNNASDKLYGLVNTPPSVVPLPAAGWLLIAGLGGLGVASRRKRKAQTA